MLNLFVDFGFQLFNMKTLFYFKLRICAGMIDNLKTRNIALNLTPFRSTEVGIFVAKEMLINTRVKVPIGSPIRMPIGSPIGIFNFST